MLYNIQLINKSDNQPTNCYIIAPNVFEAIGVIARLVVCPDIYDLVDVVPYNQD